MTAIFPSLISANLLNLQREIELLEPYVEGFHIDIMDGHFVPNLTWGPAFINQIRSATHKRLWVHLMVDFPERYLDRISLVSGDIISIHWESPSALGFQDLLNSIKKSGYTPSVALNPQTSLAVLESLSLEHVLLMSVEPGFSGQKFIDTTFEKLRELKQLKQEREHKFPIAIDGGITALNAPLLVEYGAEQLALASAIFSNPDRLKALSLLNNSLQKA